MSDQDEFDELYQSGDLIWIDPDDKEWVPAHACAAFKQALALIGDIGYDYDGCSTSDSLKKLIDEMVGYARNPQSAVDALLTAEGQE